MNRKPWIVGSILLFTLIILGIVALRSFLAESSNNSINSGQSVPVRALAYCNIDNIKPCVVSFGLDMDGNMLVNILLPDLTYPGFYLQIMRGEVRVSYSCKRIAATPNNAICIGEKLSPGESLHLMLISTRDNLLLAEGELSIIGLAFPTMEVAISTAVRSELSITVTPTPTEFPDFVIPTMTQSQTPTQTKTSPSYPNPSPSYPNPSYP